MGGPSLFWGGNFFWGVSLVAPGQVLRSLFGASAGFRPGTFFPYRTDWRKESYHGRKWTEKIGENDGTDRLGIGFEEAVLQRYGKAAREAEVGLCVPVNYDSALLQVIPAEILAKDYGCGDPSRFVKSGETVLDLGSGSGKACYIMSQVVGAQGKVIGVDFNPPMLALARKHQKSIGNKLGYYNVEFRRGKIQDLKTDLELVEQFLPAPSSFARSLILPIYRPIRSRSDMNSR